MPDLLLELLSEEIPARMQPRAREDLRRLVTEGLVEAGLTYAGARAWSTPRRLALAVHGLAAASPGLREERKGPRTDAPEAAIAGFLRATGLSREALEVRVIGKAEVFVATIERPGRPAAAIVAEVVGRTVRDFPWPKSMRWGAASAADGALRWVRPLRSILCLLADAAGATAVPPAIDGIAAGTTTEGHRFMAPGRLAVTGPEDYARRLRAAKVMLDPGERIACIRAEATSLAFARGLEVVPDARLEEEVAGLVEWPVVLMGTIAAEFLHLPAEVLQTSMREHQKFFSARNPATGRIEGFLTVANCETADGGATILAGNARVLAARLADARFFWDNDLRTVRTRGLEGMAEGLAAVTFHGRLGSQADRVARIEALARELAPLVGAPPDLAAEAARVAKADLRSAMVGEFPELQGIMGAHYARAAGLPEAVAAACREHYQPLGPSDAVPSQPVSVAVALADKLDTLAGFWAIDEKPTGSKDPYALRRAALGVIRLVVSNAARLSLLQHLAQHFAVYFGAATPGADTSATSADLLAFLHDRLKVHLREAGIRHDVIDACLAMPGNDDLTLLVRRAEALSAFLKTDDGGNLVQGFRRAANILAQAEAKDGVEYSFGAEARLAADPAEAALFAALDAAEAALAPAMAAEDFAGAMATLAALRAPIDAFFEAVQVNTGNAIVRRNRLNLLHRIRETCRSVADLARLEG
ncbi:MAG: glycine--tRNA ligase subunit beta [Rhodobacteraceae bacterium]|jgi:glycyl-tRNA synthetase beta chain|nr:glycine--tRNA ligase subunit beta [Paracoccaceae bacterium]